MTEEKTLPSYTYGAQVRDLDQRPEAVSVIIPCYNEQDSIRNTIQRVHDTLTDVIPFDVVIVNDGSTDGTDTILLELQNEFQKLQVVHHSMNRGYGAALKTGIRRARAEWIVITDSDGSYPIEDIPRLLQDAGPFDMVVGARTGDSVEYPFLRRIPKVFLKAFASWIAGENIVDINSGLRVFRKQHALSYYHVLPEGFSFTTTITLALLTNHYRISYVPVNYAKRIGTSKIRPISDTLKFIQLILRTGIYFAPLRIFAPIITALLIGFFASLCFDVFVLDNLTDKTSILLMLSINAIFFAFIADMIDKRSQ